MSYKVLLIDHDPSAIERFQRPLADAGYDVVVAKQPDEAPGIFERERPDLAVVQALFPERSGVEICREIKDSSGGSGTPVVLLLEEDEEEQARARALDLHGCDALIDRSISGAELLGLCEQLLGERAAQADTVEEPAPEEAVDARGEEPAKDSPEPGEELLGSEGLADALTKLDSLIDENPDTDRAERARRGDGLEDETLLVPDEESIRRAEKAGDFSFLAEEGRGAAADPEPVAATRSVVQDESAVVNEPQPVDRSSFVEETRAESRSGPEADTGKDIADHLDSLFSSGSPAGGSDAAEPPVPAAEQPVPLMDESILIDRQTAPTPEFPSEPQDAGGPEGGRRVDPEIVGEETEFTPAPSPPDAASKGTPTDGASITQMQTETFAGPAPVTVPPTDERGGRGKRWWLIAASLAVLVLGGGALLFLGGGSSTDSDGETRAAAAAVPLVASRSETESPLGDREIGASPEAAADGTDDVEPLGEERAADSHPISPERPAEIAAPEERAGEATPDARASKPAAAKPSGTVRASSTAKRRTTPTAKRPEPAPVVTPVRKAPAKPAPAPRAEPVAERREKPLPVSRAEPVAVDRTNESSQRRADEIGTEPEAVATAEPAAGLPVATTNAPGPSSEPAHARPSAPQAGDVAEKPKSELASAAPVEDGASEPNRVAQATPEPAASAPTRPESPADEARPAPATPLLRPPELLERVEPNYPARSLKRARGSSLVLKLLVNEKGRISRVLVERGTSYRDLEVAAISAVLQWVYRPATENGEPVRSWTTAEFTF